MAISSATSAGVTTQGIGSGLDIAGIVDKLMKVEQIPLDRLKSKESAFQTRLSAYGAARGALASFQASVAKLSGADAFASLAASVGDATLASVAIDPTRSTALAAGTHTLRVDRLASAQRTASPAFADSSTAVGTGTISIEIGTWSSGYASFTPNADAGSTTLTIDASSQSLSGVRDAINRAGAGVTAAIVNDGTGDRLVLSGAGTGNALGFRISVADADGNSLDATGLSRLAFDPSAAGGTPQTQRLAQALDANFVIDGLAISKPGNRVTDAIEGLAIDLKKVDAAATTFTVSRDGATAKKNVTTFVDAYNNIVGSLGSLTGYDPATKSAGVLNGDSSLRLIGTRLQSLVASTIPTGGDVTSLADVGIRFGDGGKLVVDDAKLTAALANAPDSVARLFAATGQASDSLVRYTGATAKTQIGSYPLTVAQLATRGTATASASAGLTITAGVNDTFDLTLDNVAVTVVLQPGTYADAGALAAQVQSRINGTAALAAAGASVSVSAAGGALTLVSQRFGSGSSIAIGGGNGSAGLFGGAPVRSDGLDVAGTLDGASFIGSGRTATGAIATRAEGLALEIGGGLAGSRGSVDFSRGIAARLADVLDEFLDADDGLVAAATESLSQSISDIQKREEAWTPRLAAIRARYTAQYNAMDALVASLNNTSSYLTQQLEAMRAQFRDK